MNQFKVTLSTPIDWSIEETVPDKLTTIILLILTTKDCVKKVHGLTLIFGVVAITTLSMGIEMGLRLLPDLEAYINEILYIPKFKK